MIYLLEDDEGIREMVCYSLSRSGSEVRGFGLPSDFFAACASEVPELVLLDVMLPEEDGISVLRKLRAGTATASVPVIMLTAKSSEFDKVMALDSGADDYVTKPFGVMELIARVKALLRRASINTEPSDTIYTAGRLTLSAKSHEVTVDGEIIGLTYKEFELLALLFENRGRVLSRDKILTEVWGYDFDGENRTVDVHIRTLRKKLGTAADVVETVRGVGYKIAVAK